MIWPKSRRVLSPEVLSDSEPQIQRGWVSTLGFIWSRAALVRKAERQLYHLWDIWFPQQRTKSTARRRQFTGGHVTQASRTRAEWWEKTPLLSYWYCLPGAPRAAGGSQGIVSLSSIQMENALLLCKDRGEGQGADGVLQVNDRARKKIQASARLIWSPTVEYSPSAFPSLPPKWLFFLIYIFGG